MKTAKQIGEKVAEKVERAKERIARKVGKKSAKTAAAIVAVCLALCGCSTTGQQPAKSQTQNNELHDCIVIVGATKLTLPQGVKIETKDKTELPELGIMTQMQSLESSGTESYAQRADPRNTTDFDTAIDVPLNKGNSGAATAASGAAEKLLGAGADWLSGKISKPGLTAGVSAAAANGGTNSPQGVNVANCASGNCSKPAAAGGLCVDGNCNVK